MAQVPVVITLTKEAEVSADYGDTPESIRERAMQENPAPEGWAVAVSIVPPSTEDEIPPQATQRRYKPDNEDGKGNQVTRKKGGK